MPAPSPGSPLRIGVAGLGAVAQAVHLPLLARHDDAFRIAGIADLSATLRDAIGERYQVPPNSRHRTVAELIAQDGLDGLVLLTSGSHGGDALAALDRGLAVLCEKPLATTVREADALAAHRDAARLLLGYMKTFDPAVVEARRTLVDEASTFGDLRSIDVHVFHPTSEAQLAFAHLLPPPDDIDAATLVVLRSAADALVAEAIGPAAAADIGRLYGGILLGSIVHELSVIRAVTGEAGSWTIDQVDAWPDDAFPGSINVVGRLPSGLRVTLGWHYLDRYPAYREEVRFHAPGGSIELTFGAPYRLHHPTILEVETGGFETRRRVIFDSIEEAFELELLAFGRVARGEEPPPTGIADGRTDTVTCQRMAAVLARARGVAIGGEAARA